MVASCGTVCPCTQTALDPLDGGRGTCLDDPQLVASDVQVTNASSVHGPVVAEHAMADAAGVGARIAFSNATSAAAPVGARGAVARVPAAPPIQDASLALVGVGSIGGEIAKRALAFGMRVWPSVNTLNAERILFLLASLDPLG